MWFAFGAVEAARLMSVEVGKPLWTEGGFTRVAAQDDLGIESVGAGLLRRLLPGVVQTTPNAGYYSFYPYLLARWEDTNASVNRADFKPWYRRQEAAYAVACSLHDHRDGVYVNGINGRNGASRALASLRPGDPVPLGRMAEPDGYMKSPYGGYGLFYGRVLADMRLTQLGTSGQVDKVTDLGRGVTERFAEAFEDTDYFDRWVDEPDVPLSVLSELGDAVCLCTIPGRADHDGLMDVFIRMRQENPDWEARRVTRVESLGLFLSFHDQRPEDVEHSLGMFRRALLTGRFPGGSQWRTPSLERWNSWRAYQLRETAVVALGSLWTSLLAELDETGPSSQRVVRDSLVAAAAWQTGGLTASTRTREAVDIVLTTIRNGEALVEAAEQLEDPRGLNRSDSIVMALSVLLRIRSLMDESAVGFDELLDEGGSWRWSLRHLAAWFDHRAEYRLDVVLSELLDALLNQHRRVALIKVRALDTRDPFCVAEDNGILSLLRSDQPFWTGARYGVVNHLLWTLGLLAPPDAEPRLTPLGSTTLDEMRGQDA